VTETARSTPARATAPSAIAVAVSVTGVAGPGGATVDKPVGLVHLGIARRGAAGRSERHVFPGDRAGIRRAALRRALEMLRAEAQSR
jgi:nicotinamide-nucleotide amidase